MDQLLSILTTLSKERPVFHSEADFQHALAWEIHNNYSQSKLRLEYNPTISYGNMYLDIWVTHANGYRTAIELKYITKKISLQIIDESFNLKSHGAPDLARYDCIKDIVRIETVCNTLDNTNGFAIILSNEPALWKQPVYRDKVPNDLEYRIHNEKILEGELNWGLNTGQGTMKGRESSLNLLGTYKMTWLPYSKVMESTGGEFKIAIIEVPSKLKE
ncbi:hypothetical protein RCG24_10490 [Neobacillus sp. OS1-32]|uniref:hypothetical protein n=1 Tax=Neobacillus sp. OS1-32 TaxID=3070682 RepID=UPI0027DF18BC|nr:hypothetical protein [Neobacillus sp. OS1-32]WML32230.1 hypothetical protein RCG24_10490 [Neobacillus sp. OS1-32]